MEQEKEFNKLYIKYYKKSFQFVYLYVRNDLVAEDISSDSLVKLWQIMRTKDVERPMLLLLTILKNKSLDYLRQQSIRQNILDDIEKREQRELNIRISTLKSCDPENLFSDEIYDILQKSLLKMPDQTSKIFRMSRFDQKSGKEIAQELNITVKGVDYHISKALKLLRLTLKDYLPLFSFFY